MPLNCKRDRSGFVFLEALMVLFVILAILGLSITLAIRICLGPLPWYVWCGSAFVLPILMILLLHVRRIPPSSREGKRRASNA